MLIGAAEDSGNNAIFIYYLNNRCALYVGKSDTRSFRADSDGIERIASKI